MKNKITISTIAILIVLGTIAFLFQRLQRAIEGQISDQVVNSQIFLAETGGEQIKNIFKRAKNQLSTTANSFAIRNLLAVGKDQNDEKVKFWKDALANLFVNIADSHKFLHQIRFIDTKGQEIVRVDRKRNKVTRVINLQDKSKEFYFSKGMSLGLNGFYLSPITLNREFGKIEIPRREVIRLVKPVFLNGQKKGVVVMNIEMKVIYNIVDNLSEHAWLIENSGKLLDCSIGLPQEYHDKLIEMILQQSNEKLFHLPLDQYHKGEERSLVGFNPIKFADVKWYLISELPFDEISEIMSKSNRIRFVLFFLILLFFSGALFYFYKLYADQQRAELKAQMAEDLLELNKQLEKKSTELESANQSLEEIDKRKTDFLNMVAHDLRTPLTSIRSYSDLLIRYGDTPGKEKKEYAGIIKKESVRLSNLIDNFLDISKIEAGIVAYHQEELDINEIIDHFVAVFQGDEEKHQITIKREVENNLPHVFGDKERLGQVFSNLLSNAIKFTHPRGTITIKARKITKSEGDGENPFIQVSIVDTGIGIPEDSLEKIFDKFIQVNHNRDIKSTRGTGLGLTITKEIIEQHGGEIKVESEMDKGSTFIFTLKASERKLAAEVKTIKDVKGATAEARSRRRGD